MRAPNVTAALARGSGDDASPARDENAYACGLMTFVLLFALGVSGGGYSPRSWRVATLALGFAIVATLLARERITVARREVILVGALGSLAAWTAASAAWSSLPSTSTVEAERVLLYGLACLAAFLAVERASIGEVVTGAIAGITATSAYALVRYVVAPPPADRYEGSVLYEPFGYSNALGLYAAVGIVLSLGMCLRAPASRTRVLAAAALPVLGATLALTSSRGAWVAVAVGSVVMLFLRRAIPGAWLAVLLVAGVAGGLALGSLGDKQPLSLTESRLDYWRVAWHDVVDNPLLGSGAGTFGDYLRHDASVSHVARDAHNVYLETLAELGPIGLALLATALVIPLLGLGGRQEPVVAAAGGAYAAFLVHAGLDWDWEFAAVVLAGLSAGVVATIGVRPARLAPLSAPRRHALLAVVAVMVAVAAARLAAA